MKHEQASSFTQGEVGGTTPPEGSVPLGSALRSVRHRIGLTLEGAAAALHISSRTLSQIESDVRTPTQELLGAICDEYRIDASLLDSRGWVKRVPPRFDIDSRTLWLGWIPIEVGSGADNEFYFRSISAALRTMRSLAENLPVYLRSSELSVIASIIDLDDPDLAYFAMRYFRQSWLEANQLVDELRASVNGGSGDSVESTPVSPAPEHVAPEIFTAGAA